MELALSTTPLFKVYSFFAKQIVERCTSYLDPLGQKGVIGYKLSGMFNGSSGVFDLLIHSETNVIFHMNFISRKGIK